MFWGWQEVKFQTSSFWPPKNTSLTATTYNDVLCMGMCPKMRPVGVTKKGKKRQKLSCIKLAIFPDHPRRYGPWNFECRVVSRRQLYISSFMKISQGVSELWRAENRHLQLAWPITYTTACTALQAVIKQSHHLYNKQNCSSLKETYFKSFVLASVHELLVLRHFRKTRGRVFRPQRERNPRVIQHLPSKVHVSFFFEKKLITDKDFIK